MFETNAAANQIPRVAEFYHGKSVFLTGAAGFVGSVLLETLLRCCTGIKSIYILLRAKRNMQPHDRKEQIFNKKIFEKIKDISPNLFGKVRVISGDVSLPNLGMNEDETHLLLEEVAIVFHCAAVIHFKKPLEFMFKNNVLSSNSVIELCRKMRKFEVLVLTSTAYSNCNHLHFRLKEEVYRLPFHAEKFLDALRNEDKEKLEELTAHCKPDWPNSYCFSKCLAENVIMDTASDLPVAILRPSMVVSTWKHPISGYIEENFAIIDIPLAVGKGIIKVIYGDPTCKLNLVPVDVVANTHILAAWGVGTKRCASPLVVNCTATENFHVELGEYMETMSQLTKEFPLPQSFKQPNNSIIVSYKILYWIIAAYYHYVPAIVLDGMRRILGKNPKMYCLYRVMDKLMSSGNFFSFHSFEFERNNLERLDKLIYPEERKDLSLDFRDVTTLRMAFSLPEASPFYDWKRDKKSQRERARIKYLRHVQIKCIQVIFLMICCLLIYWMISFICH